MKPMRDSQRVGDRGPRPQTRPFGSSGLGAILAVAVFFVALVIAGALVLGDDDDDSGEFALADATATATSAVTLDQPATTTPGSTPQASTTPTGTAGVPETTPRAFPTLTPAPTATSAPEDDAEPTPTPVVVAEAEETTAPTEDEADPEPTEPDESEEPVEDPPAPVEEPVAGDFGFLPPPQLPSGGAGQSLTLDYQLGTSLELVPTTATVYLVEWPSYSADEVQVMATNLGIDAEVVEQGGGVYSVAGSDSSLFVSSTVIEYSAVSSGSSGLPSEDVAIDAAWSWFSALGIGGIAAGDANVVAFEEETGLAVVALRPASPAPNLAPTPAARIKVSADGVVEEAHVEWPADIIGSDYGVTPALELWEALRNGQAFISADLSESGSGSGTVTVTDISIAYTVSGSPSDAQYIVPLVVFGGTATINGSNVYVSGYVPAVYHQGNPLG